MDELQALIKHAARQANAFLDEKRSRGEFLADRAVPRDVEQDVQEFIERSNKMGCILIGPPGMGKTHIVCQQVSRYLNVEYPVLAYSGRRLELSAEIAKLASDISEMIVSNLGLDPETPLTDHLSRLDSALAAQDRFILIFLDGIERPFSPDPQIGPQHLLQALDTLVRTWAEKKARVKLLITCVTTVWDLYPTQDLVSWPLYFTKVPDRPLIAERFNRKEFKEAYRKYLGILPDQDVDRFESVERICEGDPFVLKLISEVGAEVLEGELSTAEVFDKYYKDRILGRGLQSEKEQFLASFVKWLLEKGQEDIPETLASGLQSRAYQALLDEGILIVNRPQETVQLHHTRLTEYLIGRHLEREYPDGRMDHKTLYDLIQKAAPGFHALWEAMSGYLARWGTRDQFVEMARSADYEHQEMVLDAGEVAGQTKVRPEHEIQGILGELLRDEARQSKAVALRAAVRLREMDSVLEETLNWIMEDPTVAAEHVYLSWREMKETRLGDGIWDAVDGVVAGALERFSGKRFGPGWRMVFPVIVRLAGKLERLWERFGLRRVGLEQQETVVNFILSFTWRVLINECYDRTTIERMSRIWEKVRERAGEDVWLGVLLRGAVKTLPEATERRVNSFAGSLIPPRPPYLPPEGRSLAKLLDPTVDLSVVEQEEDAIFSLLSAQEITPVGLASLALSVQTHRDLGRMEPVLRRLCERSDHSRQLAILAGFALHAERNVSEKLIRVLRELTKKLLEAKPSYLTDPHDPWSRSQKYELSFALAPLGLTWCNWRARGTAFIEPIIALIDELGWSDDERRLRGVVESLVPVGIYFPEAALNTLLEMRAFERPGLEASLRKTLGIIQAFNGERVYHFLRDHRVDVRPDRLAREDFDRLLNFFTWLSTVNFVYYSLHTENLRSLWVGAIMALTSTEPLPLDEVVRRFAGALVGLAQEKNFQLLQILEEPFEDPQAIIRQIAGPEYAS